jgi:hypothetical protein
MSNDVEQIQPADPEISEERLRRTAEPDIRAVSAARIDTIGGWHVNVWVMQLIRSDPLESELRQRMADALGAVSGVSGVEEQDRDLWFVTGIPSGKALVEAAAQVVDDLADLTRAYVRNL